MTVSGTWVPAGPSRNAVGGGQGGEALAVHAAAFPRGEELALAVRGEAARLHRDADVLRAGRLALRPCERGAHGVLQGTEAQPGRDRLRRVHAEERGPVGIDGRARARAAGPGTARRPARGASARPAQTSSASPRMRSSSSPSVNGSAGPIALKTPASPSSAERRIHSARSRASIHCTGWERGSGASVGAAAGEPRDPVREAVGRVVRADDQTGAHRERRGPGARPRRRARRAP